MSHLSFWLSPERGYGLPRLIGCTRLLSWFGAVGLLAILLSSWGFAEAQDPLSATLSGTVADATGAVIPGAHVRLIPPRGVSAKPQFKTTDNFGAFSFLTPPGSYTVQVEAPNFVIFESRPIALKPNGVVRLPVRLVVAGQAEEISVDPHGNSTDPANNGSALVFEGDRLALLSDDNATLQQQLRALAGPGLSSGGPQFYINGFSGGNLPPKSSIRSIRINANPFSASYDSLGFGRVEIQTKPGTDEFHGALNFFGTDQPFNARNPYTTLQPPYHQFQTDGNLNGPINKKTSFFASENIQLLANNAVVNAVDPANTAATFSEALPAPQRTDTYSFRVDRQFSPNNFAYLRNEWSRTHITNSGIAPLVLPDAAFSSNLLTNTLQGSDTEVIGAHAVDETRFQYIRTRNRQDPNSTAPSLVVEGSFQAGGNPAQALRDNQDRYELQNLFEWDHGKHSLHAGFRFRELRDANVSTANFNGQYTFASLANYNAAQAALQAAPNGTGVPGASQFNITAGKPSARLFSDDIGLYAEDDWKLTKNIMLSYGLRFESESAIPDHVDPAPRLGIAWAVHRGKAAEPFVTLHGGYGIFYDRFSAANLLQAIRQNGTSEIAYFVQNPDFYPQIPPTTALTATEPTIYRVNPHLRSSYQQVGNFSVDRAIGKLGSTSTTLLIMHGSHNYLSQNVNAPFPGTYNPAIPGSGVRPLGTMQNIYQFNSDSNDNEQVLFNSTNLQLTKRLFLFGFYVLDHERNESAGSTAFPSNQYNVAADYARASNNHLQTVFAGLVWSLPHGFQLQPFFNAHSGAPFDITTGTDLNGDTLYNDRPAFATDMTRSSVVRTAFGNFDTAPLPNLHLIPRNYATAPGFAWLDLQAGKDFHIGPRPNAEAATSTGNGKPAPAPKKAERPWDLKFQVEAQNVLNRNNPGLPIGVLSSPYFGRSLSLANDFSPLTASNRTILLQSFFTF